MSGVDRSEFNTGPLPPGATFSIERVGHGLTEDRTWRGRYNECVSKGVPVGFYYVPETPDVSAQAQFFQTLIGPIAHTMGLWLDFAVGDGVDGFLSTGWVDQFRSVIDCGLYTNGAGLDRMPEYSRFERLWYAGSNPPHRWLMWQTGGLNQGVDVDVAADLGVGVRAGWTAFNWPNA